MLEADLESHQATTRSFIINFWSEQRKIRKKTIHPQGGAPKELKLMSAWYSHLTRDEVYGGRIRKSRNLLEDTFSPACPAVQEKQ